MPVDQAKLGFIVAYFDDLERKIAALAGLSENGYEDEALTLALVYIDGLAQRLCWPSEQNGVNFVQALAEFSNDPEMALVHPLQLAKALERMNASWHPIAAAVRTAFPGPAYELLSTSTILSTVARALTAQQGQDLAREAWRGTIAAIAYYRMRNPAVHALGASTLSFGNTTHAGNPAQPLDLPRLQQAASHLAAEARRRSESTGDWFGNDLVLS